MSLPVERVGGLIRAENIVGGSQIVPPSHRISHRLRGKRLSHLSDGQEPTPARIPLMWHHIDHRTTVDGHHEGLALGHPAHDCRVVVTQLGLLYHHTYRIARLWRVCSAPMRTASVIDLGRRSDVYNAR